MYLVQLVKTKNTNTYIWRYVRNFAGGWEYAGIYPYQEVIPTTKLEASIVRLLNIAPTTEELEEWFKQNDL